MLSHPQGEEPFPYTEPKTPLTQLYDIPLSPVTGQESRRIPSVPLIKTLKAYERKYMFL